MLLALIMSCVAQGDREKAVSGLPVSLVAPRKGLGGHMQAPSMKHNGYQPPPPQRPDSEVETSVSLSEGYLLVRELQCWVEEMLDIYFGGRDPSETHKQVPSFPRNMKAA